MKLLRIFVGVLWLGIAGCTPQIPNKITPEEYELYNAWVLQHFESAAPVHLYFDTRTFPLDPFSNGGCGDTLHKEGVSWSMIKQLHVLGEAQYPLDFYSRGQNIKIPWDYSEIETLGKVTSDSHIIGFSRAAFSRSKNEALFGISDACGGLCGYGGYRYGEKVSGKWKFRKIGCQWVY